MKFLKYLLVFVIIGVQSQTIWNLDQCVDYAVKNHPIIKQSILSVHKSDKQIAMAKSQLLPNLNANVSSNYSFGSTINPATNQRESLNTQNIPLSIYSSVDLLNWKNFKEISISKMQKESYSYALEVAKNEISMQIIQLFFQYQYDKAWHNVLQTQINGIESQIKQTEKEVEIGTRSKSDIYDVKANLGTIQEQWISAKNAKELSKNNLLAALAITQDSLVFETKDEISSSFSFSDEVIDKVIKKNPAYLASWQQEKIAEKNISYYKADYYPKLSGMYQWNTFYSKILNSNNLSSFSSQFNQNKSNMFGVSLDIPIFNRFQTKNKIEIAKLNVQNSNLEKEKIAILLNKELKAIQIQYKNAVEKYHLLQNNFVNQEKSFNKSEEKFKEGLIDAYTLFVVRNSWLQANYNLIKSKYDVLLQEKLFEIYSKL